MSALLEKTSIKPNYEGDFYSWAMAQAALLREGRLDELDIDNLGEEL